MAGLDRGYNGAVQNTQDSSPNRRLPTLAPGIVSLPPSKSHVLRALMIAATARQSLSLSYEHGEGWGEAGDDIQRGLDCSRALGAEVDLVGGSLTLSPSDHAPTAGRLPVGEAGFLGRVAPTCAGLCRAGSWQIDPAGSLQKRESQALWSALSAAGVRIEGEGGWPLEVTGPSELGELHLQGAASSQELSALWVALAARGGGVVQVSGEVPSAPYLELTRDVLGLFGACVQETSTGYSVSGVLHGPRGVLEAEVDASAAAIALAAGCIGGVGIAVPAPTPGSSQGDWKIVEHLRLFGCVIEEEGGLLIAAKGPQRGVELDLSGEPDLAPALVAVAAHASHTCGARSVFSGLHTLDGKESRRGQVLCEGFREAGVACEWRDPVFTVGEASSVSDPRVLNANGDHRMAFAFALLGVSQPTISVGGSQCIAKSWPNFWSSLG